MPAYVVPRGAYGRAPARYVPHIFTRPELRAFFQTLDTMAPEPAAPQRHRVYPVLFRLLYGAGLRVSEAVGLTVADVDTTAGWVHIRAGKFGKERRVPLHPTLTARCAVYAATDLGVSPRTDRSFPLPMGDPTRPERCTRPFGSGCGPLASLMEAGLRAPPP
ncbi:MAG: tyrosine-type recombinase/integrase [Clostridia bacterium]